MLWEYLRFLHIAAAFFMVSGIILAQVTWFKARATDQPAAFGLYMKLGALDGMMSGMSLLVVAGLGVLTAWRMGIPLDESWLMAAYGISVVAFVLPPLTLKKWGMTAGKLMPQAMAEGKVLPEQRALVFGPRYIGVNLFMWALLVLIVVDMVFKPF